MIPAFVPFAAMTDAEQRDHLRDWHGCPHKHASPALIACHTLRDPTIAVPHTHDKPARRDT